MASPLISLRRAWLISAVCAGSFTAGCAKLIVCTVPGGEPLSREGAEAILKAQAEAWNRGDIETFMEHYWKSPELTFSSGGTVRTGWDATIERYRTRYPDAEAMGRLTFSTDEVRALGGGAGLVLGRWHLERAEPIGGNFSLVLERIDGRWVITHDHTSVLEAE